MEEQSKTKNIYQKLLEIQKRIVGLGKDKAAYGYKYVTGEKVLEHLKPLMNDYGILLKQEVLSIENVRQDYATKSGTTSEINSKVMMRFTWVDCETGEKDINEFGANGQNAWDKGVGSALTYGERYFLLKYFHISTDEDDIDNPELKAQQEAEAKKILDNAIKQVQSCKDKECTIEVWNKYPNLKSVEAFKNAVAEKGKSFEVKAPEQPTNEPQQEEPKAVEMATEKQMQLVRNLYNSHHVHDAVYDGEELTKEEANTLIDTMTDMIAKGTEHEKSSPATDDQVKQIGDLLYSELFTDDERKKGFDKLQKGYSIAQARNAIGKLTEAIEKRKATANA
jgi:hypothetical protein